MTLPSLSIADFLKRVDHLSLDRIVMLEDLGIKNSSSTAWKIFYRDVVEPSLLPSEIGKVCRRYNFQIIPHMPLKVYHIYCFAIAILDKYYTPSSTPQDLAGWLKGFVNDPSSYHRLQAMGNINLNFQRDYIRFFTLCRVNAMDTDSYLELLAKVIASCNLTEGLIIPAPLEGGSIGYYRVYRRFDKDGLLGYALKPVTKGLKPIIFFRPTQYRSELHAVLYTMVNILGGVVGELGYKKCEQEIEELFKDPDFLPPGETAWVTGFSLGGAHSQFVLARHLHRISYCVLFNDPPLTQVQYDQLVQTASQYPCNVKIIIYRTLGDPVHVAPPGFIHVGELSKEVQGVESRVHYIIPRDGNNLSLYTLHTGLVLTKPHELPFPKPILPIESEVVIHAPSPIPSQYRRNWVVSLGYNPITRLFVFIIRNVLIVITGIVNKLVPKYYYDPRHLAMEQSNWGMHSSAPI